MPSWLAQVLQVHDVLLLLATPGSGRVPLADQGGGWSGKTDLNGVNGVSTLLGTTRRCPSSLRDRSPFPFRRIPRGPAPFRRSERRAHVGHMTVQQDGCRSQPIGPYDGASM
jgi:hypothetical protein